MTLAELYSALEGLDKGSEFVSTIKAEIARLNSEAKTHREGKEAAEAVVAKLTGERDTLSTKIAEFETVGAGKNSEMAALQKKIDDLTKKYETAEQARKDADTKRIQADINSQVVDVLTKSNAMDPQEFAKLIVPSIKVADDGTYSYTKADGTVGTIQDCASEWLKGKPWAIKNTQNPGSGESGGASGAEGNDVQKEFEQNLGI
ncbi:hypothetical protein [uncultured Veillonella sp.]|uniref:hypothetical protein n=1 Tax=uncultured Veillonella sp. TaxID=159268 RepID=UPI0025E17A06|nr:hypothetical protein [uncultured Veillonella sp.]